TNTRSRVPTRGGTTVRGAAPTIPGSVMADLPNAGSGYPVGNIGREREHVLVVDDAVRGRIGIGIARVRPDRMRLSALVDGQPAIVAVESRLEAVRGREN